MSLRGATPHFCKDAGERRGNLKLCGSTKFGIATLRAFGPRSQ